MTVLSSPITSIHPARKGTRPLTAEDVWKLPRLGNPAPSPDGSACAVAVTNYDLEKNEGKGRIWIVPLEGEPWPLTSAEMGSSEPVYSPDGKQIAFTRRFEKGKAQLHVMPLDGGEPKKWTDLPLGVFDPQWLPDGSGIVFGSLLLKGHLTPEATKTEIERRDKDPVKAHVTEDRFYRYWDTWLTTGEVPHLFLLDFASGALRDLMPDSTSWFEWMDFCGHYDISPDGKEIAYAGISWDTERSIVRSSIFTIPVAGGPPTCLTADHPADDVAPRYRPDGKAIVYGMTHDPTFYADRVRLMSYDRAAKTHAPICADWDRSPTHWEFTKSGALAIEAEDAGRVALFLWKEGPTPRQLVREGSVSGLAVAGDKVFFNRQSLVEAPELFTCGEDGGGLRQLTRFTDDGLKDVALGEVREMTFAGAYGESVQMFVVLPPGFEEGKKYPLVQVIHGGPHGISADSFHMRWNAQLFAAPGYVAAMVNFQGSTSWGQNFAERILGAWGDRPFDDVMKATDVLIESGLVDETRMAAAGGSYGGYMASWVAGHTDRFKCIVNHAGVYDTLSQYASDWTMGRNRAFGGEPWDGLDAIDQWNPARFTDGFNTPMLVLHGERDYRVPVTQGLECYGVLKAKGVPARLVYFPDENHWVLKPQNSLLWYREVHGWLERWLGKS